MQLQQENQTAKLNLLRKCGLLAHTSAAFLKNCCTEKLFICLRLVSCNPTTNHPHRKELIPWQLFLSVPPYWMLWCSPALLRATPTAMNSPTKSKACSQSQSPHSIPFCGDCKKTNTYKPMTSPIKGETAGITTSPMPDGRLWKPTAPNGSSTNNKLTNF